MTTNPISAAATPGAVSTPAAQKLGSALGKDDFLKLMVGQLKNQDPMQPTDNSQFLAQMAQFSQLEQTTNMAASTDKIVGALSQTQTLSLIGRSVTYQDASGASQQGSVDKVDITGGTATLTVAGIAGIQASAVTEVK